MAGSKVIDTTQSTTSDATQSTTSQQTQSQESLSSRVLDQALVSQILSGLMGNMTDEQRAQYAENLLRPQLNAGLESAQQQYDQAALTAQQRRDDIAAQLARDVSAQQSAYRQNVANVENAALARGMGRSSYTVDTIANQGAALAQAVRQLTDEAGRQENQIAESLALAGQQNAQTQGRLNEDYAANLAAKIEELRQNQTDQYNSNYMTAISSALGERTTSSGVTNGTQNMTSHETSSTDGQQYEQENVKKRYKENQSTKRKIGEGGGSGSGSGNGRYSGY